MPQKHPASSRLFAGFSAFALAASVPVAARAQNAPPIALHVDATDAPRYRIRVRETIPAKPGRLELAYPKWIPGEHMPSGPLNNVVDLHIFAGGREIPWRRDLEDLFVVGVDVPPGADSVEVDFTDADQAEDAETENLARVKWNRLLMYPRSLHGDAVTVRADVQLPDGWQCATALPRETPTASSGPLVTRFAPVTLNTLIDSPILAGRNFRVVPLPTIAGHAHELDMAAETPGILATLDPATVHGVENLIREADALFGGAHHYTGYHYLLTVSNYGGFEGLEHHESSEVGVGEAELTTPGGKIDFGDLMAHEYAHSWNGKFRRPAGLATPDYTAPMHGDLLWVYEGLTQYLGTILPARSGLFTPQAFQDILARTAAEQGTGNGRLWRSVGDTATAVQVTYRPPEAWHSSRRGDDYYVEGALIWLEADALIRTQTKGQKSLDDFCRLFYGGPVKPGDELALVTYDRKDVVHALNQILPYDWDGFFRDRIDAVTPPVPTRGIVAAGWRLVLNDTPPATEEGTGYRRPAADFTRSLGIALNGDGAVTDLVENSPADKAGLTLGVQITAVNGQKYSSDGLENAVKAAEPGGAAAGKPITLLTLREDHYTPVTLTYTGGLRYAHLERDPTKSDVLAAIIAPLASKGADAAANPKTP